MYTQLLLNLYWITMFSFIFLTYDNESTTLNFPKSNQFEKH